jgi:hypothetical protein
VPNVKLPNPHKNAQNTDKTVRNKEDSYKKQNLRDGPKNSWLQSSANTNRTTNTFGLIKEIEETTNFGSALIDKFG